MALFSSPFFKKLKGRIGNIILYEAKGQQRLRCQSAKKQSGNTDLQNLQRCRMRAAVAFYRANSSVLFRNIWKIQSANTTMSGYNMFLKFNLKAFNQDTHIIDYSLLQISCGSLELPAYFRAHRQADRKILITWCCKLPPSSERYDDILIVAYLKADGCFSLKFISIRDYFRKDCKAVIELPEFADQSLHLYCFFSDYHGVKFSPSRYFYME